MDLSIAKDPNVNYAALQTKLTTLIETHLPVTKVKIQKYKHKLTPWITQGNLKSLKYCDTLYKKLKKRQILTLIIVY